MKYTGIITVVITILMTLAYGAYHAFNHTLNILGGLAVFVLLSLLCILFVICVKNSTED